MNQAFCLGRVADMDPESELLLCCARTHLGAVHATYVQALLERDIDWGYLLWMADAHGVMPLLHQSLYTVCPDAVPPQILARLHGSFANNAQNNLVRTRELLKVLALLKAEDIPAVPLKGPVLAAMIYGNLALRQFCDLDILIRPQDTLRARNLLLSSGYRPRGERDLAPGWFGLQSRRELQLTCGDGRIAIDLQWHIPSDWRTVRAFPLDAGRLWERLETFTLAGATVSTFAPPDLLLILCVHGASHGWMELRLVCDLAELVRSNTSLDLEQTLAQADVLGITRMVLLGLFLTNSLLEVALPADVCHRIQADPMVRPLALQVHNWVFGERAEHYISRGLQEALFSVRLRERFRDKIPYVFYFLDYPRRHFVAWLRAHNSAAHSLASADNTSHL